MRAKPAHGTTLAGDPIAARYAQAVFEAATAEGRLEQALEQLELIGRLIGEHPDMRELMLNPGVDPEEKVGIFERVLKGTWSPLLRAFIAMVVSRGRAEALPGIAVTLRAMADEAGGRLRATVRSAHALPEAVLARLRKILQAREGKTIDLIAENDPALLGGLQVVLGHRVIDSSVRQRLTDLRQQLARTKVT